MYRDMLKRVISVAILYAIYYWIMNYGGYFSGMTSLPHIVVEVIITLIFYFISTKFLKISYDNGGLKTTIIIFLIINLIFSCLEATDIVCGIAVAAATSYTYAYIGLAALVIIGTYNSIKRKIQGDGTYQQAAEDLDSGGKEMKDITGESELTNRSEPYINYNLQKAVLENIKKFLLDSGNDFLLIDEEYHLQAGNDVYNPDLILYHMQLKCHVAVDLRIDDFKPEYLDRMDVYLETLNRDFKKPNDNPSMGIILCKNEDTEVVENCFNKSLSQEMAAEYEAKLIDKKILKEKLGELYDMIKEPNLGVNT